MKYSKLKIILDTNILISSLSPKLNYNIILDSLVENKYELYLTTDILLEYEEKIILFFNSNIFQKIINLFSKLYNVNFIKTYYNLNLINKDFDDNKFVDCAFACNADYIVTNDKHFNVLKTINFPNIKIISISEFVEILKNI